MAAERKSRVVERTTEDIVANLGPILAFLRQLWSLSHALERTSIRMEGALGVTAQQRFVLRILGKLPALTPGRLAQLLHVDPGSITAVVKRLEARGLVARKPDTTDRRRVALTLTAKGKKLDVQSAVSVEHAVAQVLQQSSNGDVAALKRLVGRLVESLDQVSDKSSSRARARGRRA